MHRNIPRLYAYAVFVSLSFCFVPIFMIFMKSRGLSYSEIGLVLSAYYAFFLILELPTGMLADRIGRVTTLRLGMIAKMFALAVSLMSYSMWMFLFAEFLFSVSRSMESGADSAFLYDNLVFAQRSEEYMHIEGKMQSLGLFAHLGSATIAAVFAIISLDATYLIAMLMATIGFATTLRLKETPKKPRKSQKPVSQRQHLNKAWKVIKTNRTIQWTILYSTLIFILLRASILIFIQPFLIEMSYPDWSFGVIDGFVTTSAAVLSWYSHAVVKKWGERLVIMVLPSIMTIGFLIMGITLSPWSLIAYVICLASWGLYIPVTRKMLNEEIPSSDLRATLLSVESFFSRGVFSLFPVTFGIIIENQGLGMSLIYLSAAALALQIALLLLGRKWEVV